MYIEKIKIGNFGKLSNREFDLRNGVNIIEGGNESGKSTLCEFIKFVFYGLSNKAAGGEMSERKRHISWKTNDASGSIVLNTSGKSYRIERSMVAHGAGYKDDVTVVDLSSNSVVTGIKNPGEFFFGIPEEVFTRTVYIRQREGAYFNGGDIGQSVENIFYSADESINTEKALKKLDEARVLIKHKKNTGRGLIDGLERERDELTLKLAEARRTNELVLQNEASLRNADAASKKNKKDIERMSGQMRKVELHGILCKFEESKKYEDAVNNYKNGKNSIVTATTFNGFFPDEAYADEVEKAKNELTYLKKNVDSFEESLGIGEAAVYSQELCGKIKEMGGKEGISELLDSLKKKKKAFTLSFAIALAVAVLTIGCGILFAKAVSVPVIAGTLILVGALICFALALNTKKTVSELFEYFESDDEAELFETVTRIEEGEKYNQRREEMLSFRLSQKKEAEKILSDGIAKAMRLLDKWGVQSDKTEYDGAVECLDGVISDISEILDTVSKYDREIDKNEAVLEVIKSQLSGYDENSIRDEYNSIDGEVDPEKIGEIKKRYDFAVKAKDTLDERVSELMSSLAELRTKSGNPADLESRLNIVEEKIEELNFKYEAYVMAYEKLQNAGASLRNRLAPGLSSASGKLMEGLTDGKYKEIGVSDNLEMTYTFEEEGMTYTKTIDCVSSGTQDIAYVSLRLALAELFGKSGEKLPVIFDEAFSRLDNTRLKNMLLIADKYANNGSQAIVMTSQTREAELCRGIDGVNMLNI